MADELTVQSFSSLVPVEGQLTIAELIETNTGGQGVSEGDISRLSIPAGGGLAWEVPSIDGDPDSVKDLEVVILAFNDHRVFYEGEYTGDNRPPRCSTKNLHVGQWVKEYKGIDIDDWEFEDRYCAGCDMNQWGSAAKGRGKACSERRLMLILTPGVALPFLVDISPGSLTPVRKYFNALIGAGKPFFHCVTNLKLKKVESGGGIPYSQVNPVFVRDLSQTEVGNAAAMREALAPALETAEVVNEKAPY